MDIWNFVNTVNYVNIVNIANIVEFHAITYKIQYNDSLQVHVSRQTGNFMKKDNFSAIYVYFEQLQLEL